MRKGDRFVAYGDERPARWVFIEVTRVARDGTWADILCGTWVCGWTKRQKLLDGALPYAQLHDWGLADLEEQEQDHMAWLREEAAQGEEGGDGA